MRTKKDPTQSKKTFRTVVNEAWQAFLKESDEAWRDYGRSDSPSWVARRNALEQIEAACKKAVDAIDKTREEGSHAD